MYRDQLIDTWLQQAGVLQIPASEKFSLTNTLGDPVMIREWQNQVCELKCSLACPTS